MQYIGAPCSRNASEFLGRSALTIHRGPWRSSDRDWPRRAEKSVDARLAPTTLFYFSPERYLKARLRAFPEEKRRKAEKTLFWETSLRNVSFRSVSFARNVSFRPGLIGVWEKLFWETSLLYLEKRLLRNVSFDRTGPMTRGNTGGSSWLT